MELIRSDMIRGYNDMMILCLVYDSPSYGYEISKQIKERSEEKYIIKETTLYSAFARLEEGGYLESFYGDISYGTRRTYYRITPRGKEYYQEMLEEWSTLQAVIRNFIKEVI